MRSSSKKIAFCSLLAVALLGIAAHTQQGQAQTPAAKPKLV